MSRINDRAVHLLAAEQLGRIEALLGLPSPDGGPLEKRYPAIRDALATADPATVDAIAAVRDAPVIDWMAEVAGRLTVLRRDLPDGVSDGVRHELGQLAKAVRARSVPSTHGALGVLTLVVPFDWWGDEDGPGRGRIRDLADLYTDPRVWADHQVSGGLRPPPAPEGSVRPSQIAAQGDAPGQRIIAPGATPAESAQPSRRRPAAEPRAHQGRPDESRHRR